MKNYALLALGLLMCFTVSALAQEHFTEGPVWQISLIHVKPNQEDAYLTSLRERSKPLLDEQKRQGLIMDYKWFFNTTMHGPNDWNMALAVQYKNFGAMDGEAARAEAIRDKIFGSKQTALQVGEKRVEMREIVETLLLREIMLR